MTSASISPTKHANIVALQHASSDELERISREGLLSLTRQEMETIQRHFRELGRDPTDVELETIAQTWSEHCYHKTFRARYTYTENQVTNEAPLAKEGSRVFENLLKDTIVRATNEVNPDWCLSVFKDNAGVISFDDQDAVSFKVETHNHPSALEPYGGAGTGIGGVIRDILGCGLGGKPVLNTDVFCFGPLHTPPSVLPEGALSPQRIAHGVISGVRDYGNRMGIPTANGAIYFDSGYIGNPLVFCGTVGLLPKNAIEKTVQPGDLVVVVGGRTGRDGIHGATFSSAPLEKGITSSVVQIGHAIMEKKTMDVLLKARDQKLYRSITDCGAGGFSSAIGELGKDTGVEVNLEKAPLKYPGLQAWEIWLSESQERMVLAVPPENWNTLKILFSDENVEAVAVGQFTNDQKLVVKYQGDTVAQLNMDFLHDGCPKLDLNATWNSEAHKQKYRSSSFSGLEIAPTILSRNQIQKTLLALLQHPVIASKESVVRQYDHEVQAGSVVKPFMGVEHDGPTDACVFRPKLSSWKGVAVSNGLNPELGKWDPYLMAKFVVDEAYRNMIAVGGGLHQVAILDNFCWGDSHDSLDLAGLVRAAEGAREAATAYQLPFISGKDSFHNTWKAPDGKLHSIPPTLLVSAIGLVEDVRRCLTPGLKGSDNLLYLIGETRSEMAGALASALWNEKQDTLPTIQFSEAKNLYKKLMSAMKHDLVLSCHDLSEGGLAVAAAEMAFGSKLGVKLILKSNPLSIETYLFTETPSRLLVEVSLKNKENFEQTMGLLGVELIGTITKKPQLVIEREGRVILDENISKLKDAWKKPLHHL